MKHNMLIVYRAVETLHLFKGKLKVFQAGCFLGLSIRACSSIS